MKTFIVGLYCVCLFTNLVKGQDNMSLKFDGVNGYVNFGTDAMFELANNFSLEAWVKADPNQSAPWGRIIDKFHYTRGEGYNLVVNASGGVARFEIITNGGIYHILSTTVITDNEWHYLVATYSDNTMKMYVDGIMEAESNIGNLAVVPSSNILVVGSNDDGNGWLPYKGNIDQVRIWNTVLTASQVSEYMTQCLTGSEVGLIGYWDFNSTGNGGTAVLDKSNYAHSGTLMSGSTLNEDVPYRCASVGVIETMADKSIDVVPNPFSASTTITLPLTSEKQYCLKMYNTLGQLVKYTSGITGGKIMLEKDDLAAGIYDVNIMLDNSTTENIKIIVE